MLPTSLLAGAERLLLSLLLSFFGLIGRVLGRSYRRLLAAGLRLLHRAAAALVAVLGLLVPGSFQLAHTIAGR